MGLFSKKYTPDDILDMINELPEEDRAKFKQKFDDLYKAEDEREIDKIEEEKSDSAETEDEKSEEVNEESEEIGKDVDEIEKEGDAVLDEHNVVGEALEGAEAEIEKAEASHVSEEHHEESLERAEAEDAKPVEADNTAEVLRGLTEKVNSLEGLVSELTELKTAMEEYVNKQKDSFGYQGNADGKHKSYDEMSEEELKNEILYR